MNYCYSVLLFSCMVQAQPNIKKALPILMHTPSAEQYDKRFISWSATGDLGKPYSSVLNSKDVNNTVGTGNAMKTISEAGRYYFTEDVHIMPVNANVTCFKITASNVVLDMRGYSLTGATATGQGSIGIEIATGVSNVIICNGNINSINGNAIKSGLTTDNITIKDVSVSNCTAEGVYLQSTDSVMERVRIFKCTGTASGASGAFGLYLTGADRFKAFDCSFNGNAASGETAAGGVYISSSNHCEFIRCDAKQNAAGSSVDTDYAAYGFYLSSSNNMYLEDCVAGSNTTSTGTAYGFYINGSSGSIFKRCRSHRNTAAGAQSYGFNIDSSSSGCFFEYCIAERNTSDEHAYGFYLDSSNYNYLKGCDARNQTSTSLLFSTTVAGFYSAGGIGNTFEQCVALGNSAPALSGAVAAGFYLTNGEQYTNVIRCHSQSNSGSSGKGYGIWLDSAKQCTIRANEVFVNTGDTNGYGIRDELASSVSTYFENFGYGNGTTSGLVVNNFDVRLSPNDSTNTFPVHTAFLTDFRTLKDRSPYDNIELLERGNTDSL